MADLAGYRADVSLIRAVDGTIHPMSGGGMNNKTEMVGGAGEKDIKLFNKTFSLPNPATLAEADLDKNEGIREIMNLLQFNSFSFEEKKKILQALYDSNCTNETDLALSCGCDPVRKVIADLATLLLQKTAEKAPLPKPVKKVSGDKRLVEISIKIPLEMIRVVMSSGAGISGEVVAPAAPAETAPAGISGEVVTSGPAEAAGISGEAAAPAAASGAAGISGEVAAAASLPAPPAASSIPAPSAANAASDAAAAAPTHRSQNNVNHNSSVAPLRLPLPGQLSQGGNQARKLRLGKH